ncbi:hypothetical protein D3C78_1145100 [compost metagenome]
MLRRATIDSYRLALEAQFAGMTRRAGDIQELVGAARVLVPRKPYRQVAGIGRRGFLRRIDQEAEARQVLRRCEALLRKRQFEGGEPVVAQAFDLGALGCEVIRLALGGAPLIQVMHLFDGCIERQARIGDVIEHHGHDNDQQREEQQENAREEAHGNVLVFFDKPLCLSAARRASGHYPGLWRSGNLPLSVTDDRCFIRSGLKSVCGPELIITLWLTCR